MIVGWSLYNLRGEYLMNNNKASPTRKVDVQLTDNGGPFSYSMTSHNNIHVNAEVQPPLQLPGLIVFKK